MQNNEKIFFPGLNSLRAIAALTVTVFHFNQFLPILYGLPKAFNAHEMGLLSVVLFFVLSGFLITYLLLIEKENYGKIDIIKFYKRRALKIWPLYYLIIILSIILFPFYNNVPGNPKTLPQIFSSIILVLCMLPNISTFLSLNMTMLRPFWSIGVEEQFYLIWPWIVNKYENILKFGLGIISSIIILKFFFHFFKFGAFYNLIVITPIHLLIVGGIGAYLLKTKNKYIQVLYNRYLELFCFIIWLFGYLYPIPIPILQSEVYSILFLVIILNISTNPKSLVLRVVDNKILDHVGRFSYGLYVLHLPVYVLLSFIPIPDFLKNSIYYNWIIICIGFIAVVVVAQVSYLYYEKPFLKIKEKFMLVRSTDRKMANGK